MTDYPNQIQYLSGYVSGFEMITSVSPLGYEIPSMWTLGIDESVENEGMQCDGVLGLSPGSDEADLLVDLLYDMGHIECRIFTTVY